MDQRMELELSAYYCVFSYCLLPMQFLLLDVLIQCMHTFKMSRLVIAIQVIREGH